MNPDPAKRPYALRGCLWCAVCGRRMQSHWAHGTAYYRCRFAAEYAFVDVHVVWDEGEANLGAGNVTFQLPVPAHAAKDSEALRAAALEAVRRALD